MVDQKDVIASLKYRMKDEGLHYCFDGYSDWREVEDDQFHKLRKEYLEKAKELQDYVRNM
jgi:hypothetical protein